MVWYKDCIFMFGGHDLHNEKLGDFWKFDITQSKWELIESLGTAPSARSGHTIEVVKESLILFGGILEITKETDETYIYDVPTNTWSMIEAPANKEDNVDDLFLRGEQTTTHHVTNHKESLNKRGKNNGSTTHFNHSSSPAKKYRSSPGGNGGNSPSHNRSNSQTLPAKKLAQNP
jgi:hypothetical protein